MPGKHYGPMMDHGPKKFEDQKGTSPGITMADVVKARKGAKQVLNLLSEYTAFINLLEKQSSDTQNISKLQTENKAKSKLFKNLMKQNK